MNRSAARIAIVAAVTLACMTGGCGSEQHASLDRPSHGASPSTPAPVATHAEAPLPAESNPPGDIPDTQAFVSFRSPTGAFVVDVPEGWARSTRGSVTRFVDKFDGLSIGLSVAQATEEPIRASARAGAVFRSREIVLPGGRAVLVSYTSNSDPDPVTDKRVRLENVAVIFSHSGRSAILTLWAPLGADNVDQWNRIERSFRWR